MENYGAFKTGYKPILRRRVRYKDNCCGRGCCFEEVK